MNASDTGIAARFFLDDVPGANSPATRLHGILKDAIARRSLSVLQQDFLREQGYEALLRFALGELDMETFRTRAQEEREGRLIASAAAEKKETADKSLRADVTSRKNAALFAERKRKLKRRKKVREIPDRFGLPFIPFEELGQVNRILRSVVAGKPIKKGDLVWLGSGGAEYWTDELRKAHHENMARISSDEWNQTKDVWKAVNACAHWRKAERSQNGLDIAETALGQAAKGRKRSALLTTGGGALRDLDRLEDALRFGTEAHALTPEDFRPCTLLGAVHMEKGAYVEGAEWYKKAEERGASRNLIDRELQAIVNAADPKERKQIKHALKSHDASRYGWLK